MNTLAFIVNLGADRWHRTVSYSSRSGQLRRAYGPVTLGLITWLALSNPAAQAQSLSESSLTSFTAGNGYQPQGSLINVNGTFYGTTQGGGANKGGTVYAFGPANNFKTTIYAFGTNGSHDATYPQASLTYDSTSKLLYGTTFGGGANSAGTLYSINPATHVETVLYSFGASSTDGRYLASGLLDLNGTLYGTAFVGGTKSAGTVFSYVTSTKVFKTLYTFGATTVDGSNPRGDLVYHSATGKIFGTTYSGGSHDSGTIFAINPTTNAVSIVYSFGTAPDGSGPQAGLTYNSTNGLLYGTTYAGGAHNLGTVFSFDPSTNGETSVYSFAGTTDGAAPYGGLTYDSTFKKLYGTTTGGGTKNSGTVFSFDPTAKTETVLYRFQAGSADGSRPYAGLLDVNGVFYGTTMSGGSDGYGTIFVFGKPTVPIAVNHSTTVKYNTLLVVTVPGVLGGVNNGGSSSVTAALSTKPSHGTLTLKSDGSFTYAPTTGYAGTDSFTYQAVNLVGKSNIATVTISVQATAPIAKNDSNAAKKNTTLSINAPGVLNDDDNGGKAPMTAVLVTGTSHGKVTLNSNGGYVYTPNAGFTGTDTFTYQAVNAIGKSNIATVTVTVQ